MNWAKKITDFFVLFPVCSTFVLLKLRNDTKVTRFVLETKELRFFT